jgi:hypothetical protein
MRRAWYTVCQSESLGERGTQWSVDWAAAQYQLAARHPAFVGDAAEPWEVGEALRTIASWKNKANGSGGGSLLMQLGRELPDVHDDDDDLDGDEAA